MQTKRTYQESVSESDSAHPSYIYVGAGLQAPEASWLSDLSQAALVANGIRNPLASIRFQIELVRNLTDELDPKRESMDLALEEIDRVTETVDAVLDHSQLPQVEKQNCDIAKTLDEFSKMALAKADRRGVSLRREGFDRPIPFLTDPQRLGKAVKRLLDNAVEACAPGQEAQIFCDRNERGIAITIMDQGHGISEQDQSHLGEAYFTRKPKGLGLGFHLAKRDLESLGAELSLRSQPDRGTTLQIQLTEATQR